MNFAKYRVHLSTEKKVLSKYEYKYEYEYSIPAVDSVYMHSNHLLILKIDLISCWTNDDNKHQLLDIQYTDDGY